MADVGARIYDFFRTHGYSPAAAAGIIGNTTQESSNNPNAPGGGLIQGQGGRTSRGTLQQQLHGILGELQGSERHTAEALARVKGPREAARIFSEKFERPGIPMLSNRERYAEEALRRYGGREVAHVTRAGQLAAQITPHLSEPAGPSSAQTADIVQMLQAALAPQQGSSVAATALPRPQTSGGGYQSPTAPRVPAVLTPQPKAATQDTVLGLLAKLGQDASTTEVAGGQQPAPAGPLPAASPQAQGKLAGIVATANRIGNAHVPYLWGGGHAGKMLPGSKVTPLDCSGAVSAALGINPKVSGEFESWGAPGKGRNVTIWANAEHVLMEVNGRFWGTSRSNPGGGAGWIKPGVISKSYLRNFTPRHPGKL